MLSFISCAKTMSAHTKAICPEMTNPVFLEDANRLALWMSQFGIEKLEKLLHVNRNIAKENFDRFQHFFSDDTYLQPSICAYTGTVFKRIHVPDFLETDFLFAQRHLLISSFIYGLLRPLDGIKLYRAEGNISLPESGNKSIFEYWQPRLTDFFISAIEMNEKILINLASEEMKNSLTGAK